MESRTENIAGGRELHPKTRGRLPWVRIIFLLLVAVLYGMILDDGNGVFTILSNRIPLPGYLIPSSATFGQSLEYTELGLWVLLVLCSLSILNNLMTRIFPSPSGYLDGKIPTKIARRHVFVNREHIEKSFSSAAESAEVFVASGHKESLLRLLEENGTSTQWLDSYRDRKFGMLALQIVVAVVFAGIFFLLPTRGYYIALLSEWLGNGNASSAGNDGSGTIAVIIILALLALIVGSLLFILVIGPFLDCVNRKARRQLIVQWTANKQQST